MTAGEKLKCPKCKQPHNPLRMCRNELREALEYERVEDEKLADKVFGIRR